MPKSTGVSVSSALRLLAALTLATLAGVGSAQTNGTPPQLLPYTAKLIAGSGTTPYAKGATCPSGLMSTDIFGDGCLATEIQLGSATAGSGPRYAVADSTGAVYFSDYLNGLIRRVDPVTGVITVVAGGGAGGANTKSPAANTACGAYVSTDAKGDGCLATAVVLSNPTGLVLDAAGNLYFGEYGNADVRKIAAISGSIANSGVISLVAGNVAGTYGYTSNFGTTTVNAATASYLDAPFGLSFDTAGNLYIADEYKDAVLVVNTNSTGSTTVTGVTIPAGTIAKIAGTITGGGTTVCPNSPATTNGCKYGNYTAGVVANSAPTDSPWAVAAGPSGFVYFANEYNNQVAQITPGGTLNNYAGILPSTGTGAKQAQTKRATAGTFAIGSDFGVAVDPSNNVYVTDALNGAVWRIDGSNQSMYIVAGDATNPCNTNVDAYGDGCPALQAKFGASGTTYSASGTTGNAGIYGVSVDANNNLYVGDTVTNLIREIASGTQFGTVGANQPIQIVDIHFATADGPLSTGAYSLIAGASNFSLGTATCTTNSDNTTDCLLPITATPSTLGAFTGTLQVKSNTGQTSVFALSGTYAQSPVTRTSLAYSTPTVSCAGTTTYSTTTPITFTSGLTANGPAAPGGTITFYANNAQIGTPQNVTNMGTTSAPVYGATLSYTFTTPNTYTVKAVYSGDAYFKTSSSSSVTVTTSVPTFTASMLTSPLQFTLTTPVPLQPGQTGLYSFTVAQNVYAGTLSFSCSGLPANSSCVFSPSTLTASGCSTSNTVALSILTQGVPGQSGLGGGSGRWLLFSGATAFGLALLIGLRRRKAGLGLGQVWMALALLVCLSAASACSSSVNYQVTPVFSGNVQVNVTGSTGTISSFSVPLLVN